MEDKYNRNMFNNKLTNVFMEANQICFAYLNQKTVPDFLSEDKRCIRQFVLLLYM